MDVVVVEMGRRGAGGTGDVQGWNSVLLYSCIWEGNNE